MPPSEKNGQAAGAEAQPVDRAQLTDLRSVTIRGRTPGQRLRSYLSQVEDPCCFRVGDVPVRVTFVGQRSLEDCLRDYFTALKDRS